MQPARRRGHEQGGATIEFVGVMVVVVALVASVVVAVPQVGGVVTDGLSALVCRVTGQGCAAPEGTAAGDPGQVGEPGGPDADQPDAEDAGEDGDGEAGVPDGEGGGDDDGGGFLEGVGDFFGDVGDVAGDIAGGVGDFFGGAADIVGDIAGGVGDFFGGLFSPIRAAWDSAWQLVTNPLEWLDERWDNLYNHVAFWHWDTFADSWVEAGKGLLAWDEWGENWPRALGIVTFNAATLGVGALAKRFLFKGDKPADSQEDQAAGGETDAGDEGNGNEGNGNGNGDEGNGNEGDASGPTPEQNRERYKPPEGAPGYDTVQRTAGSDRHILDGEGYGRGGHRPGTGFPGVTEFPDGWSDQQILDTVDQATQNPVGAMTRRDTPGGRVQWSYEGEADGIRLGIVLNNQGRVVSAFPLRGQPGTFHVPDKPAVPPTGVPNKPIYTRPDPQTGRPGYFTYERPDGTKVFTDENGQPIQESRPAQEPEPAQEPATEGN